MPLIARPPPPLDPFTFPSTSWLASQSGAIYRSAAAMASELPSTIHFSPEKRTVKFDTTVAQPILHDHYLSSEEDLSSSEQESVSSRPTEGQLSRSGSGNSQRRAPSPATEIDEHVARTITFIAPGKPRLIDVNTFGPIYEARPARRIADPSRSVEPYMRLRIREGRELERIARSRSMTTRPFAKDDPYSARKPLLAPLNSFGSRSTELNGPARQKQTPLRLLCQDSDSTVLSTCAPSKLAVAHSALRGVANTLISAKRRTGHAETSCLAHA